MSYRIIFKGTIPEEFVDEAKGLRLSEAWEENKLSGKVRINDNLYEASSIKAIISGFSNPDKADKNAETTREMQKIKDENKAYVDRRIRQTPKIRAQNTEMAELVYMAVSGKRMSDELRLKVIEAQEKFFIEKPNYAEANPICYKDLFKEIKYDSSLKEGAAHIATASIPSIFGFVERVVINGIV